MPQVVYADLLFLVNFGMDILCLYITSRLLHRKMKNFRAVIAAVLGGVYSVLSLFLKWGSVLMTLSDLTFCVIMCLVAFGTAKLIFTSAVLFGVSVGIGGMMTAMYSLLNRLDLPLGAVESNGDGISVWLFAILALISGIAASTGGKFFKTVSKETVLTVKICYNGKTVQIKGMTDTGNLITEPISGRPIIVVDKGSLLPLMTLYEATLAEKGNISGLMAAGGAHKVRLVPISTAGGTGSLCAFVPDEICVSIGDKTVKADALFAPAVLNLGNERKALGCAALVPPSLI